MPTRGRGEESLWGEVRRGRPAGRSGGDVESDPKTQKVLDLQQSAGNAAVSDWLGGGSKDAMWGDKDKDSGAGAGSKELDAGWGDKGLPEGSKDLDAGWGDKDAPADSKQMDAGWFGDKDKDKDSGAGSKEMDAGWFDDKDAAAAKDLDAGGSKELAASPAKAWFD